MQRPTQKQEDFYNQEKSHLPKCPTIFIHPNIFLDYINLCREVYIHILGFS